MTTGQGGKMPKKKRYSPINLPELALRRDVSKLLTSSREKNSVVRFRLLMLRLTARHPHIAVTEEKVLGILAQEAIAGLAIEFETVRSKSVFLIDRPTQVGRSGRISS
jgi:hypothetical protein